MCPTFLAPPRMPHDEPWRISTKAIHRSAWKAHSRKFGRFFGALMRFCAIAHIHSPKSGVSCLRCVASRRRVKAQDSYLSFF